ncbi:unnamed protein product [Echinostoma caproni]|uniref:Kunitz/Bovine pancreatic trypsin inhibitor domain protein n=1 Tax=Echinostoma caproni TaxID=27848 RepID=A0A183ADI8_9TREM|nr:unnamed protein product [Echinostoma caproni]
MFRLGEPPLRRDNPTDKVDVVSTVPYVTEEYQVENSDKTTTDQLQQETDKTVIRVTENGQYTSDQTRSINDEYNLPPQTKTPIELFGAGYSRIGATGRPSDADESTVIESPQARADNRVDSSASPFFTDNFDFGSAQTFENDGTTEAHGESLPMFTMSDARIVKDQTVGLPKPKKEIRFTEPTVEVFQAEQLFPGEKGTLMRHSESLQPVPDTEKDDWVDRETTTDTSDPSDELEVNTAREACYQRPIIQPCSEDVFREGPTTSTWYYDPVEMACHLTSDCITNANSFPTEKACKSTCIRRCLAPPKAGYFHCSQQNPSLAVAPILMVFFDKTTGKCRWFTYYGCGGTANRFRSIAECEATCSDLVASKIFLVASDLCQTAPTVELNRSWPIRIPEDPTTEHTTSEKVTTQSLFEQISLKEATMIESGCDNVGQMESRWYLDVASGVCKEFAYSHCGGSSNNFLARTDCEQFCAAKKENPVEVCLQSPDPGQCSSNQTMWYFDPNARDTTTENGKGICRTFTYTGCAGNSNRFATHALCESMCGAFKGTYQQDTTEEDPEEDEEEEFDSSNRSSTIVPENDNKPVEKPSSTEIVSNREANGRPTKNKNQFIDPLNIDLEPCRRPPETGRCRPLNCSIAQWEQGQCAGFHFQRWFFNAHTSNCEPFNYTGCGGSENTFDDAESCHSACKARIVRPDRDQRCDSLPHQTKCYTLSLSGTPGAEQKDNVIAFHFSVASATCKAFQLDTSRPGCSMKPYFSNGQECIRACVKSTPTERHLQSEFRRP